MKSRPLSTFTDFMTVNRENDGKENAWGGVNKSDAQALRSIRADGAET